MSETIKQGNYVLVLHDILISSLKEGHIVAFNKNINNKPVVFIKRIVAEPSDTLFSNYKSLIINNNIFPHDTLYDLVRMNSDSVNNNKLYLEYLKRNSAKPDDNSFNYNQGNKFLIVPPQSYFLIGDNYYESMDSRFWGFIHEDDILGKVIAVF